jgi:hypothetical protein
MNKLPDTTDECLVQIEYESGKKIYLLAKYIDYRWIDSDLEVIEQNVLNWTYCKDVFPCHDN